MNLMSFQYINQKSYYNTNAGLAKLDPQSKPINKHKPFTSDSTQNLLCRDEMWQDVVRSLGRDVDEIFSQRNGCTLRKCNKSASECRGAHCIADIKPLHHITKYNKVDKVNYDWVKLYLNILKTMEQDLIMVKKEEHKRCINDLTSMNFIDLIQLWRNMACYYNKAARDLPYKKDSKDEQLSVQECGFLYRDDVPLFKIADNLEDTAWAFERLTRFCHINQKFEDNIKSYKLITIWDLCLATGLNCKEGIHCKSEKLCTDDFLTGKCSCHTEEQIVAQEIELSHRLINVSNQLVELIKQEKSKVNDGWETSKTKKSNKHQQDPKIILSQEINHLENQIKELKSSRFIHYTELGMIPFEKQYEDYLVKKSNEVPKLTGVEHGNQEKKENWDHGMVGSDTKVIGPIIKLTKFGNKKK